MTVLARTVRATPYRAANEAWDIIVDLLTGGPGAARDELLRVSGIASSVIASEATTNDPIVVSGAGPRVRVYCAFDDDAITGDNANEQPLPKSPTEGNWSMSLPCPDDDLEWVKAALAKQSTRVTARKVGEAVEAESHEDADKGFASPTIDKGAFFRP